MYVAPGRQSWPYKEAAPAKVLSDDSKDNARNVRNIQVVVGALPHKAFPDS